MQELVPPRRKNSGVCCLDLVQTVDSRCLMFSPLMSLEKVSKKIAPDRCI